MNKRQKMEKEETHRKHLVSQKSVLFVEPVHSVLQSV